MRVNHQALALAVKRMIEGPFTAHSVVEVTGLAVNTAYELVRTFHKCGTSHVSGWEPNTWGADATPIFTLGPGKDKKRRRASTKEKSARYRERKRAMKNRDPLVAALHADQYEYRGFIITRGASLIVQHDDPYFKPEGYPNARAAHGTITRYINSRGLEQKEEAE